MLRGFDGGHGGTLSLENCADPHNGETRKNRLVRIFECVIKNLNPPVLPDLPVQKNLTADYADGADKGPCSVIPSAPLA